ncbi:ferritin-like domain-containing protein [Pantoea sp. Aalb]|uniref:ferritin-like domain-containing protein n=1 Tax=Pantoea sp. Aalb TaxID=2576762 RepID=UPI001327B0D2|nr:DUF892 family protein [Pantoea sp. Aalb]MXP67713.1 ferritin-like domain-containing protein [Pantoea sp. Aalb]
MNSEENFLDWVKDAHAMEKQAESMLEKMASRLESYSSFKERIEEHIKETHEHQILVQNIIDHYCSSRSLFKDVAGKLCAFGQSIGGMMARDEIIKNAISNNVFEHFEIASYTSLITAALHINDTKSVQIFKRIREQEIAMADWTITNLPNITEQYLIRSDI